MSMKQWIPVTGLAVLSLLSVNSAIAHGSAKPMYGGIVQMANDLTFELVADNDGAILYLMDHGKPMSAKGITGKLTILQGSKKTDAEVKEAGDNKLRAAGVKLAKGDKLVAVLANVAGKNMTVRFTVK